MTHRFLVVPVVIGVSLFAVGCATKKFVREELQKSEAKVETKVGQVETKVGQDVTRLEGDIGQEKTRLTGVAAQATEATRRADQATGLAAQAATKADEAGAKAAQALTKADEAMAKADQTDSRLTRLWASRNKRNLGETVVVVFGFDKWTLDDRAQTSLLDLVKQLQENPNLVVDLEGYTDNVGPSTYNVQLSQRRAEAVRRFLAEKGIELHRVQSVGFGDIRPVADNSTRQGRDQNRRVAIKLFTPPE